MFYELKNAKGELVKRSNPQTGKDGKALSQKDADAAVLVEAKAAGAVEVIASDGRKVL